MQHLPIWYLSSLPENAQALALQELREMPARDATMGSSGDVINKHQRDTTVRFAPENYWLGDVFKGVCNMANQECKWAYEISGNEAIQFAEYGPRQHYNWHTDTFPLSGRNTDRKITVVCLLNDPSEFEGGEFQVRLYNDYTAPLTKGSVIAFPSILEHRVTPVLSGVRYSATMWFNGPRFR